MDPARVGVIGCGRFATKAIYPSLRFAPLDLIAVCSRQAEKAERTARIFGARRWYTDYRTMLAREELDGVFCITGDNQHLIALDALARGLNVFIEKPPAPDLAGTEALLQAAERSGRWVQVGFMKRFAPSYRRAKEIMQRAGEFGRPTHVLGKFSGGSWTADPWDFLTGMTIHLADLFRFLLGEVEEVTAYLNREGGDLTLDAVLRFAGGAVGVLTSGEHLNWYGHEERLEVTGCGAQVIVDNGIDLTYYPPTGLDRLDLAERPAEVWSPGFTAIGEHNETLFLLGYAQEVRHFAACLRDGAAPEVTVADGYAAMRLCRALLESEGKPVKVAEI